MNSYRNLKIIVTFLMTAYISIAATSAAGNFTDLQNAVDNTASGAILTLIDDYTYASGDLILLGGISINKNLVIDGGGHTIDADNQTRIFNVSDGVIVVLENITFVNGNDNLMGSKGGAVYSEGNLSVESCTFTNNTAYFGAALYVAASGDLKVNGSTFRNNVGVLQGGAIYAENKLIVSNSVFENNMAEHGGSGIKATGTTTVTDSVFESNSANFGTISANDGLTVSNSEFKNNSAGQNGGAIRSANDTSITSSFFQNNTAPDGLIFINTETDSFLNYNIIIDEGIMVNNIGTGILYADFNWWGDNEDPESKIAGKIEINDYYTMSLTSADSPKYGEEYEFDYIFGLNNTDTHDQNQLPEFIVDIRYNSVLVDSIDGRNNETLTVTINAISNTIEAYSFDNDITSLPFTAKEIVKLSIGFSKDVVNFGETTKITVNAVDQNENNDTMNINVKLYANGTEIAGIDLVNGVGSYDYTPESDDVDVGLLTIKADFEGDSKYNSVYVEEKLAVKDTVTLTIEFSEAVVTIGNETKITVEAKNQKNELMVIDVKLFANNNVIATITLVNGVGSYDYTSTDVGAVTIKAEFEGNDNNSAAKAEKKLTVENLPSTEPPESNGPSGSNRPIPANINITISDETIVLGEEIEVTIQLSARNNSLADRKIILYENDKIYGEYVTDANGLAKIKYVPSTAGEYNIKAVFAGNNLYIGSESTAIIKVIEPPKTPEPVPEPPKNTTNIFAIIILIVLLLILMCVLGSTYNKKKKN